MGVKMDAATGGPLQRFEPHETRLTTYGAAACWQLNRVCRVRMERLLRVCTGSSRSRRGRREKRYWMCTSEELLGDCDGISLSENPTIPALIIYIASYPRSGNSLIQQLVHDFFGRPTSTVLERKPVKVERYAKGEFPSIRNWRTPPRKRPLIGRLLSAWNPLPYRLASFDLRLPTGESVPQKYLMPGCLSILTSRNRRRLAKMDSTFFIKTHALPFDEYLDGEFVVIPVRQPGAVLNSLKHYLKDHRDKDFSLKEVIEGKTPYANWSDWHNKWLDVQCRSPSQMLLLRFEDTVSDPQAASEKISHLLCVPYDAKAKLKDFEELHQSAPKHFRAGQADAWRQAYSAEELALLTELHGGTNDRLNQVILSQKGRGYRIADSRS